MVLAFTTVSAVLGESTLRGLASLFLGLAIGLVGIDNQTGQARFAFGVPQLLDGIEVVTVAVGLFAVGETLYFASKLNQVDEKLESIKGSIWMKAEDWKRSIGPWIRGTLIGFPVRHHPRGRRGDPDVPLLRDREEALQASRGVRQGRDRGRGRARGGEQRLVHRHDGAAAHARACRLRPPRRSCSPRSSSTACSPGRCCSNPTPRWSGASSRASTSAT